MYVLVAAWAPICCCRSQRKKAELLRLRQALSALQGIVEEEVRKAEAEELRQTGMASMDEKGPEPASKKTL